MSPKVLEHDFCSITLVSTYNYLHLTINFKEIHKCKYIRL